MPSIDGRRIILQQSQSYKEETCSVACGPSAATEQVVIFGVRGQGAGAASEVTITDGTTSYVNYTVGLTPFNYELGVPIFCGVGMTASVACSVSGSTVCVSWGSVRG